MESCLLDFELLDHPMLKMHLAVGHVRQEAENRIVTRREVDREILSRPLNPGSDAANRGCGKGPGERFP